MATYLCVLARVSSLWHTYIFNKIALTRTHKPLFENSLIFVCRAMSKIINQNQQHNEKSRNSLTLLKELLSNIPIVFKHSYLLKYWSYVILSMCKRISSIFNLFWLYLVDNKGKINILVQVTCTWKLDVCSH